MDNFKEVLENFKKSDNESVNTDYRLFLKENKILLSQDNIKELFLTFFKKMFKKEFEINDDSNQYLQLLLNYFCRNEDFYNSPILIKNLNSPSLCKGLLIIGNYGVGKSKILKTFEVLFTKYCEFNKNFYFRIYNVMNAVNTFETLENAMQRSDFYKKHSKGFKCYDDVKSERDASIYGKIPIIKDILFSRYENDTRTIFTCNFDENYPDDYLKAIEEFGSKYDGRIYDRIFEMFNIIVVGGKSFRN